MGKKDDDVTMADLRRVERAAGHVKQAQAELHSAMVKARQSGETFEDIGRAAGLTRQRAYQIVRQDTPQDATGSP